MNTELRLTSSESKMRKVHYINLGFSAAGKLVNFETFSSVQEVCREVSQLSNAEKSAKY